MTFHLVDHVSEVLAIALAAESAANGGAAAAA